MFHIINVCIENEALFSRINRYLHARLHMGSFTCLIAVSNCTTDTDTVDLKEDEDPK